mmetsp:Transcript_27260/g.65282  ORF Transcript_27260/g.65282 Transcript_27260/m.65282 type:complete len:87 (-) Transcript_27260:15-275(-)
MVDWWSVVVYTRRTCGSNQGSKRNTRTRNRRCFLDTLKRRKHSKSTNLTNKNSKKAGRKQTNKTLEAAMGEEGSVAFLVKGQVDGG